MLCSLMTFHVCLHGEEKHAIFTPQPHTLTPGYQYQLLSQQGISLFPYGLLQLLYGGLLSGQKKVSDIHPFQSDSVVN